MEEYLSQDLLIHGTGIGAILFDAYGTLFDTMAIAVELENRWPGRGTEIAQAWRSKQIEYALLRTLGERYADFEKVTRDAFGFVADHCGLNAGTNDVDALMQCYMTLPAHPEAAEALTAIKAIGIPMAILSNGTSNMLGRALDHAGITGHFDAVLSVERVRQFKPSPATYRLGSDHFGLPPERILFISSNGWDIAGAGWFGYQCLWLNRGGASDEQLDFVPQFRGRSLIDVVELLGAQ